MWYGVVVEGGNKKNERGWESMGGIERRASGLRDVAV